MKKVTVLVLAIFVSIFSANAQYAPAAKYNNKLMKYQQETSNDIIKFFHHVKKGNFAEIEASHANVDKALDKLRAKVAKVGAFEGDNSLKDALNDWIKGYEDSFDNEYKLMLPLLKKTNRTAEENEQLNKMHDDLIAEEKIMDTKLTEVQKAFAEKHKLTLGDGN